MNGSRTNELAKFTMANSQTIQAQMLQENSTGDAVPVPRAGQCSAVYGDKFYIFGGQDDDNNKLDDMWEYDLTSNSWRKIQIPAGGLSPLERSGATAVTYGNRMYIFGGILELTKELNDMIVFDFTQGSFVQVEELPEFIMEGSPVRRQGTMQGDAYGGDPSPTSTMKANSPGRRRTMGAGNSPARTKSMKIEPKAEATQAKAHKNRDGLGTPTSVTMMNTFIIKNADHSFDQYH